VVIQRYSAGLLIRLWTRTQPHAESHYLRVAWILQSTSEIGCITPLSFSPKPYRPHLLSSSSL